MSPLRTRLESAAYVPIPCTGPAHSAGRCLPCPARRSSLGGSVLSGHLRGQPAPAHSNVTPLSGPSPDHLPALGPRSGTTILSPQPGSANYCPYTFGLDVFVDGGEIRARCPGPACVRGCASGPTAPPSERPDPSAGDRKQGSRACNFLFRNPAFTVIAESAGRAIGRGFSSPHRFAYCLTPNMFSRASALKGPARRRSASTCTPRSTAGRRSMAWNHRSTLGKSESACP